jgi:hypothetical protein
MTTITNLSCVDGRGRPVPCDAFGNNVAFACPRCAYPMLASARSRQRGSSPEQPAICRKCRFEAWVEVKADAVRIYSRTL